VLTTDRHEASPEPAPKTARPTATSVVRRLWVAADRQIAQSELRLSAPDTDAAGEREARTLALIGKLVRDLVELDLARAARRQPSARRKADPDGAHGPRDLDRFREDLEKQVHRLVEERHLAGGNVASAG